ncbi:phage replisome organizer N-terminal domain-containing protein [Acetobacterium sp.]|uniref:phage replisome organizer N-terminal domain-containing protein n=1 Tax=Acetobacterium sp. TaxID=1872094 RepID=UPI00271A91DA|nr:phage replisome organizer N-terminal domain-containing protein [Acetobacterium sp.]MDO9492482.1 phage replisome organizer N-terminal domain-containing protein [Acetobacterium sp.]
MAETKVKKYYWLKLKENFFSDRVIRKMLKLDNGLGCMFVYLRMLLLAMDSIGYLVYEATEESMFEQLALELDEDPELIKETIDFCIKNGLLTIDGDLYFLTRTPELIGSESESAERVRKHRKIKQALQCNTTVTDGNDDVPMSDDSVTGELLPETNGNTEKEKDLNSDLNKDSDTDLNKERERDLDLDSDLNINLQAQQLEKKRLAKIAEVNKHTKPEKGLVPLVPESAPSPPPPPSEKNDISLSDGDINHFVQLWNNLGVTPPIKGLTKKQIQKLDENVKQFGDGQDHVDTINDLFDSITDSNYLMGEADTKFDLILNWVLMAEKWEKIISGEYCSWDEPESED